MSDDTNQLDESDESGNGEEAILRRGLLDYRLERLIRKVLKSSLLAELISKIQVRVSKGLTPKEKNKLIMDKVFEMDVDAKKKLLKDVTGMNIRASREQTVWHAYTLKGAEPVTSPRGRRKIALRIEHQLDNTVEALVEVFEEAVWVLLFPLQQLQQLSKVSRMSALSVTAFAWYKGESALYSNHTSCPARVLQAVCNNLGYAQARRIHLSAKRLSQVRLLYMAKEDRRFYSSNVPADSYPLLC